MKIDKQIKKQIKKLNRTLPNYIDIIDILKSSMTSSETKKVLQSLYEKGMISYWYTKDKKFNKGDFYKVASILKNYKNAKNICRKQFFKNFNKKNESAHHPIVPLRQNKRELEKNEKLVFMVITKLLIRAF